ncbi:MAG: hypothetical protein ACI86C_000978 [Candidatus Latescibacterota bacterium]|jgi:hypothetical protein
MNFKILKYAAAFMLLAILGCSSDADVCQEGLIQVPNAQGTIDGAAYTQSLMECREPRIQTFTGSNLKGDQIVAEQGTVILINPQTFADQDGFFIDGDVTISLIEMYQPGEIIACQLSTNGINEAGNVEPLFSESIYFLDITFNGEQVTFLHPIMIFTPSENLGMEQFLFRSPSCPDIPCKVLWEQVELTVPVFEEPFIDATGVKVFGYRAVIDGLGWHNIGRYNTDNITRTTVFTKTALGYDKTNANVFVRYNTPSTAIGLFDFYDASLDVFSENYAQIPIGLTADFVFATVQGGNFLYATKRGLVEVDFLTATLDINETDELGFINAINGL